MTVQVVIEEGSEGRVRFTYESYYALDNSQDIGMIRHGRRVTFSTFEEYLADVTKKLLEVTRRSVEKHGVRSDVELRLAIVRDASSMNAGASYVTKESESGKRAVFHVYEFNLARTLYQLRPAPRFIIPGLTAEQKVQITVDHEMRHHLDHDFILAHHPILDEFSTLEDYTVRYLLKCRTEGFATYRGDLIPWGTATRNLSRRLKVHSNLFERSQGLAEEYDVFESKHLDLAMIDQVFNTKFVDGVNFSPYKQGEDLMRVVACAGVGEVRDLSLEEYHAFLGKVANHSLLSLYQEYFRASRDLGLFPMFPEEKVLGLIENKVKHHSIGGKRNE